MPGGPCSSQSNGSLLRLIDSSLLMSPASTMMRSTTTSRNSSCFGLQCLRTRSLSKKPCSMAFVTGGLTSTDPGIAPMRPFLMLLPFLKVAREALAAL